MWRWLQFYYFSSSSYQLSTHRVSRRNLIFSSSSQNWPPPGSSFEKDINGETKASTFALENSFNHPATKDARSLYLKMPGRPTGRIPSGDILKGMKSLETYLCGTVETSVMLPGVLFKLNNFRT